jgi:hypothetical protein
MAMSTSYTGRSWGVSTAGGTKDVGLTMANVLDMSLGAAERRIAPVSWQTISLMRIMVRMILSKKAMILLREAMILLKGAVILLRGGKEIRSKEVI